MDTQNISKKDQVEHLETMRFLFDKRLDLFNVRREHEWKIIFSVLTAIGAADIAIITKDVQLESGMYIGWVAIIALLFITSILYLLGVQTRNRVDRIIMDDINEIICNHLNLPKTCGTWTAIDVTGLNCKSVKNKKWYNLTFLWAFYCQVLVLLLICLLSCLLPNFLRNPDNPQEKHKSSSGYFHLPSSYLDSVLPDNSRG